MFVGAVGIVETDTQNWQKNDEKWMSLVSPSTHMQRAVACSQIDTF